MGPGTLTYAVSHRTTLRYTDPVQLSYNEVRMRPRDRGTQRTLAFALATSPVAVPRTRVDYFGNFVHRLDVGVPHEQLVFTVEAVVENGEPRRRRAQPWDPGQLDSDPRLEYALPSPRVPLSSATASLLAEWCGEDRSFDALLAITSRIKEEFRYVSGATTVDSSIDELLAGGAGVCQDFTHLFLALARHARWPARYVSGHLGPSGDQLMVTGASHAWAEVCGPDGRWHGLDPTHGGPVGQHHLRLAVGRDYSDVAPHRGLFFGSAGGEPPEVEVRISLIGAEEVKAVEMRSTAAYWQQQQQQ